MEQFALGRIDVKALRQVRIASSLQDCSIYLSLSTHLF